MHPLDFVTKTCARFGNFLLYGIKKSKHSDVVSFSVRVEKAYVLADLLTGYYHPVCDTHLLPFYCLLS